MSVPEPRRRLLAILAADAAGYSRLVAADDRGTVAALGVARTIFRDEIEREHGRVIDTAGDSVLAVFESATAAAEASLAIQAHLETETSRRPTDKRLQFRIGLHLGDVIEQADGSIYGDGVNVASRLQALAEPGGVTASTSFRSAVRGRLAATFVDIGEQSIKNFPERIRTFRMSPVTNLNRGVTSSGNWTRLTALATNGRSAKVALVSGLLVVGAMVAAVWKADTPGQSSAKLRTKAALIASSSVQGNSRDAGPLSIVVLPFTNLTGDATQTYVADGLTASVTADLTRIRDVFVVSAITAFAYKGRQLTAQQIGEQLGVHYVLQGNVQRNGSKIRINAELADSSSNAQLWSQSFDGDSTDLFAVQEQVTTRIGASMGRELIVRAARAGERRLGGAGTAEMLLQARGLELRSQSLANWREVESLYRHVLQLDPENVVALGGLAVSLTLQVGNFGSEIAELAREDKKRDALGLATRARSLDPESPAPYRALSSLAVSNDDWNEALRNAERRLTLEPQSPSAYNTLAYVHYWRAEPLPAIALLRKGFELDSKHPYEPALWNMAKTELMLGHYDEAIEWGLKAQISAPKLAFRDPTLPVAFVLKGDYARAREITIDMLKADPGFTISERINHTARHPAAFRSYMSMTIVPGMRLAGFPE